MYPLPPHFLSQEVKVQAHMLEDLEEAIDSTADKVNSASASQFFFELCAVCTVCSPAFAQSQQAYACACCHCSC